MALSLEQVLHPATIRGVISQIKTPSNRLSRFYGTAIGGANIEGSGSRSLTYDIFNKVRTLPSVASPGRQNPHSSPAPVGQFTGQTVRVAEMIPILMERVVYARDLGSMNVSNTGLQYINNQERTMAQKFINMREYLTSRMLRGSGFQLFFSGDEINVVDSGGHVTVSPQVPASNIGTCGGIFAGNWQTAASGLVHQEVLKLNAAAEAASGYQISHAWCTGVTWDKTIATLSARQMAGDSMTPFLQYERAGDNGETGGTGGGFVAVLRGIPWIQWHINDSVLTVNGSSVKNLEDNKVLFTPEPSVDWFAGVEAPELVCTHDQDPGQWVDGFHAYALRDKNPAVYSLCAVDNFLPVLKVPNAVFYATVAA